MLFDLNFDAGKAKILIVLEKTETGIFYKK
jgi:hypothetical protein